MTIDIDLVRAQFPSLAERDGGAARIYLDNPAGTQTPRHVIDAMTGCLTSANANLGGYFSTSQKAGTIVSEAHAAMADFLNAAGPEEITFGQNMTTLTFHISRSLGRLFSKGDEIVVTRMDHDANIAPWLMLAEDLGLVVRWLDVDAERFELNLDMLDGLLSEKTALVAVGYASNTIGTVNDVKTIARKAKRAGALVYVDAVQYAPHRLIDVQDLGCDFLACSPYKFFGPHQGVLWGRAEILRRLTPYKVRAVPDDAPDRFETGTLSHEGMAGTTGAVDYLSWYGRTFGPQHIAATPGGSERRAALAAAYAVMQDYEDALTERLIEGLQAIPSVTVQGVSDPARRDRRLPTVAFTSAAASPRDIAERLGAQNIFVWDGHNYALEIVRKLGLMESGGVVRVGLAHYNTADEIDALLQSLERML